MGLVGLASPRTASGPPQPLTDDEDTRSWVPLQYHRINTRHLFPRSSLAFPATRIPSLLVLFLEVATVQDHLGQPASVGDLQDLCVAVAADQTTTSETNNRALQISSISGHGVSSSDQPPSWHRLGPLHVPLETERCRHRAVAIPIVAVGGLVAVRLGQQCAEPQQPNVAQL